LELKKKISAGGENKVIQQQNHHNSANKYCNAGVGYIKTFKCIKA
jgi:hypothetical protein